MTTSLEHVPFFWVFFTSISVYVIFTLARFGSRAKHLPPGPPTYPIVGNAHLVVDKNLYKRSVTPAPAFSTFNQTTSDSRIGVNSMAQSFLSRLAKAQ